jgi:hypothetical protein
MTQAGIIDQRGELGAVPVEQQQKAHQEHKLTAEPKVWLG